MTQTDAEHYVKEAQIPKMSCCDEQICAADSESSVYPEQLGTAQPRQFSYETTFRFMAERRLQRRYKGVYKQYSVFWKSLTWILVAYTIVVFVAVALNTSVFNPPINHDRNDTKLENIALLVALALLASLIVKAALVIRWMIYWIILAETVMFLLTKNARSLIWMTASDDPSESFRRRIILYVLLSLESATVIVYYVTHWIYPLIVRKGIINVISWWQIRDSLYQCNTVTYKSRVRILTKKRSSAGYIGGLNSKLQPHGFGYWSDTSYHGERLSGYWENGVPIGPFRSFEHGSGYCFVNLRIGYCTNRSEERTTAIRFIPKHCEIGKLYWGVASVECSVSGGFFTFLPAVSHLTPPPLDNALQSATDCLPMLRLSMDHLSYRQQRPEHRRARLENVRHHLYRRSSSPLHRPQVFIHDDPVVSKQSIAERIEAGKEALILLHGYNCSLDYGINRMGQLLALGDFPIHIHPFVFSWPSGGVLAYFEAKKVGAESERTASDFCAFLQSLIDAQYTKINILAHSMGARVYFSCLMRGMLHKVFYAEHELEQTETNIGKDEKPPKAKLSTLIFTNADYELLEFVRPGGAFDLSRSFCKLITSYADALDGALYYTEVLTKYSFFGPLNHSLGKHSDMLYRTVSNLENRHRSRENAASSISKINRAMLDVNHKCEFNGVEAFAVCSPTAPKDFEACFHYCNFDQMEASHDTRKDYLDMDVIDTTWMDQNVHAIRHNYFNINPSMVEDLRNLVVNKCRADKRPGLMRKEANTFIFLVAPAYVKND